MHTIREAVEAFQSPFGELDAVHEALHQAGYEVLGTGHYSVVVVAKDTRDHVFKVILRPGDLSVHYAMYCLWHPYQVGLPTVYSVYAGPRTAIIETTRYTHKAPTDPSHDILLELVWEVSETGRCPRSDRYGPFLETCRRVFERHTTEARPDIHSDNIMYDKSLRPILTDPFSAPNRQRKW